LKNRTNIILSSDKSYAVKGATVVHSMEELFEELKKYKSDEIFVAGGETVYRQLLPYCDTAHITKIDYAYEADAYFPQIDGLPEWELVADSEEQTYFDLEYYFLQYKKRAAKP
ncbi:MAG: dihydrofolate reductase, partial [Lachnospiraceae bacterium]|nr:dihydrofolate reductase [Lachnospiraceae bacterium]